MYSANVTYWRNETVIKWAVHRVFYKPQESCALVPGTLCVLCNWWGCWKCVEKEAHNRGSVDERISDTFSFQNGLKHQTAYDFCFSILIQSMPLGICKNTDRA
jgi:hypothetical protein